MKKFYNNIIGENFSFQINDLKKLSRSEAFDENKSKFGVAGNTFRAFSGYPKKPSLVYREWAKKQTAKILNTASLGFTSQTEFDEWHNELFKSLQNHWKRNQNKDLNLAHSYKLVDLYIKWLSKNSKCSKKLCSSILKYGYCALDSQIIYTLNQCLSGALPIKNATMGHIGNQNTYDYCQDLIKNFSEHYNGSRLLFDYYAWKPGGAGKNGIFE